MLISPRHNQFKFTSKFPYCFKIVSKLKKNISKPRIYFSRFAWNTDNTNPDYCLWLIWAEISPQLVYRFIEQTMQPGPSVSLKCSAAGNPTPQISWLLDGFPLPQNDRILIGQYVTVYGDVISHVNISSVKSEDSGEYQCTAASRAGETSHSARLNVYGQWTTQISSVVTYIKLN